MQPTQQDGTISELQGILRHREEYGLRHVLREMRVAKDAQGGGIDEIHMAPHQIGKCGFGSSFRVIAQELAMRQIVHLLNSNRRRKNRTEQGKLSNWKLLPLQRSDFIS